MKEKVLISREEQEMHINYSPDMGSDCEIYTTIPWLMKYLDKLVTEYPDQYSMIDDNKYSMTVRAPFKYIKPKEPRRLSEEQRMVCMERLKLAREAKKH